MITTRFNEIGERLRELDIDYVATFNGKSFRLKITSPEHLFSFKTLLKAYREWLLSGFIISVLDLSEQGISEENVNFNEFLTVNQLILNDNNFKYIPQLPINIEYLSIHNNPLNSFIINKCPEKLHTVNVGKRYTRNDDIFLTVNTPNVRFVLKPLTKYEYYEFDLFSYQEGKSGIYYQNQWFETSYDVDVYYRNKIYPKTIKILKDLNG